MSLIESYVTCPYDESHRILESRMACHLTKCSRQHPEKKLSQCPFDVRHLVEEAHFKVSLIYMGIVFFYY